MKNFRIKGHWLTLSHYKEPLRKVKKGYGYEGCMLHAVDGDGVMCHECGEVFSTLQSHLRAEHKMSTAEYREKFKIAKKTPLVSEENRLTRSQAMLSYIESLTPAEKKKFFNNYKKNAKKARKKRTKYQPKESLETKNKKGTCPDQLKQQIMNCAKELGRTPSKKEFIVWCDGSQRFVHLLYKTFGSWTKAVELCGLTPKKKVPKGNTIGEYNPDELLEYLRIYTTENNKVPSSTDFLMGLLPSHGAYIRHFGTIERARREAGVYDLLEYD